MRHHSALVAVVVVLAALLGSGCSKPQTPSDATNAPDAPSTGLVINPNTPAGLRAKQTVDMLNSDWPIGPQNTATLASPSAAADVEALMANMWWDRPFTVSAVDYYADRVVLHLVNSFGAKQNIEVRTDRVGLVNRMAARVDPPEINSWADVDAELAKSNARYSYQVAKVNDGRCDRVAGIHTDESLPTASIFKLYVLYAVAEAVKAGTLSWDDELTVTDRAKAVEFMAPEEAPVGSKLSVRTAANQMIAVSSNTATDLLIERVGKEAVERALAATGHHDPQSMTPFPTMYELFSIGWGEPDRRQQWKDAVASGSPEARARLLAQANSEVYTPDPMRKYTPASTFGVEWYATAEDICRIHAALQASAVGVDAPVRDIMAQVSGLTLDKEQWPYVGAKGGNLPGDRTFSWYAVDRQGQPWVVSFQVSWPQFHDASASGWLLSIAEQAFDLIEKQS